jgi:3-keto-disaccharide hydrolase
LGLSPVNGKIYVIGGKKKAFGIGGKDLRYIMVGLAFFLIACHSWAGTFIDDFEDGDMDEWTRAGNGGNWEMNNGELILESLGLNTVNGFMIGEDTWENYTVGVKMKVMNMKHNVGFGVFAGPGLRGDAAGSGGYLYGLGMSPQAGVKQAEILVCRNFAWWQIEPGVFEWEMDTWYNMRISIEGNQMKAYVNDVLVIEFAHGWHKTGPVSLAVASLTTAHFDDFFFTGDDVPNEVITAVSMRSKLVTVWGNLKQYQ